MLLNGQGQNSARQFATLEIAYVAGTKRVGKGEKLENGEKGINPPSLFPLLPIPYPFQFQLRRILLKRNMSSFELKITAEYKH